MTEPTPTPITGTIEPGMQVHGIMRQKSRAVRAYDWLRGLFGLPPIPALELEIYITAVTYGKPGNFITYSAGPKS